MVSLSTIAGQCTRFFDNDQSALQAIQIVHDKISREVSLGCMAGPRSLFTNFQAPPLGLVPKHEAGKITLMHDLSFPR